jgi:hypothetical protein
LVAATDDQTVENQPRELTAAATARGWAVAAEYADEGISGAKGRDGRPQLDLLLKDAVRRRFDVAMVWGHGGTGGWQGSHRRGRQAPQTHRPSEGFGGH